MKSTILRMRRQWLLGSTSTIAIAETLEASRLEEEERVKRIIDGWKQAVPA